MLFVLILQTTLGFTIVGEFDNEEACNQGAVAYMAMLQAQRSEHNARMMCVGVPAFPEPREKWDT
jgi:hypothetical protein